MNKVILNNMELESVGDDFLDELSESVQEDDGLEMLGVVISQFVWLENDNSRWLFEVIWLVS